MNRKLRRSMLLGLMLAAQPMAALADNKPSLAQPILPERVPTATGDTSDNPGDDRCPIVNASLEMLNLIGYAGAIDNPARTITDAAANMSCLQNIITGLYNDRDVVEMRNSSQWNRYWDDIFITKFDNLFFPQITTGDLGGTPEAVNIEYQMSGNAVCYANSYVHFTHSRWCVAGQVFIKQVGEKCETASPDEVLQECGASHLNQVDVVFSFVRSSPISLLWTPDADIEAETSVVDFPLRPDMPRAWYGWKASGKTPLLVYDPQHLGRITTGAQLFGPWTFGGKRVASLDSTSASVASPTWSDGYEALGSLDRDGDGVISGSELEPLGLWFDSNQDGISQPGEVRSLADVKVTELYFKDTRRDSMTGNIVADIGFKRSENGSSIQGATVDWFADTAATPGELTAKHAFRHLSKARMPIGEVPLKQLSIDVLNGSDVGALNKPTDPLAGAWSWKYDSTGVGEERAPLNYLLLGVRPDTGDVIGYSLVGFPLKTPTKSGQQGTMEFRLFTGSVAKAGEERVLSFSLKSGDSTLKTRAVLSSDLKELKGNTSSYIAKNGQFKKFTYNWTATKVQPPR
ncbi:MAG: hypothetical protein U0136_13345 [Bdellovibrionota bacterium]